MTLSNAMFVRPTVLSSTLEVLAVDETAVNVVVGEGNRAELFKIEIEGVSIDL